MDLDLARGDGRILVYPENDAEVRLVFTWLDFVRYTPAPRAARRGAGSGARERRRPALSPRSRDPSASGVGQGEVRGVGSRQHDVARHPRRGRRRGADQRTPPRSTSCERLDERGHPQHDRRARTITHRRGPSSPSSGIQDYFVSPAINWGRKSANLSAIAEDLNLGLDTFAFVDDSAFERGEVARRAAAGARVRRHRHLDAARAAGVRRARHRGEQAAALLLPGRGQAQGDRRELRRQLRRVPRAAAACTRCCSGPRSPSSASARSS